MAERAVGASPPDVFSFLADLENHWLLADRFVEVLSLERPPGDGPAHGGTVRIRGPLGVGRTARTRLVQARPPTSIAGTASVGARTEARVHWTLAPVAEGTLVRLEATVERMAWSEAILLAAGGRRWLENRFASILETLARRVPRGTGQDSSA
ncbi:MAG: SRPBCC family protein [Solirubrobacterales bacterium]